MKIGRIFQLVGAAFLGFAFTFGIHAQDSRFFRVTGPTATTITAFHSDGTLVWTNTPLNATFTIQVATKLGNATNWANYVQVPCITGTNSTQVLDFSTPLGMVLIPAGTFAMGDESGEGYYESPIHTVYISAFYMESFDVTKVLWDSVYTWAINHGYSFDNPGSGKAFNHPVQNVSWYDCVKWCNARSEQAGKVPAYYTDAAQANVYRSGQTNVLNGWVKWNTGYRLPTEAEWEKAARGGLGGRRYPWGDTISWDWANYAASPVYCKYDVNPTGGYMPAYNDGTSPYTSPVGSFPANGYGLYDMSGNVRQWVWDSVGYYSYDYQIDPRGYASNPFGLATHTFRGGSCFNSAPGCRVSVRPSSSGNSPAENTGFRCVLSPAQ